MSAAMWSARLHVLRPLVHALHGAGWPAFVGGALLVAAFAIAAWGTHPLREETRALRAERRQLQSATRHGTREPASPQAALQAFYAALPLRETLPETLVTLHRLASRHGLRETRADYRETLDAGHPVVRVRIDVPLTGSYAAIRSWISESLTTLPSLALAGIEMRRNDIGKTQLEARVRFELLLRSTP